MDNHCRYGRLQQAAACKGLRSDHSLMCVAVMPPPPPRAHSGALGPSDPAWPPSAFSGAAKGTAADTPLCPLRLPGHAAERAGRSGRRRQRWTTPSRRTRCDYHPQLLLALCAKMHNHETLPHCNGSHKLYPAGRQCRVCRSSRRWNAWRAVWRPSSAASPPSARDAPAQPCWTVLRCAVRVPSAREALGRCCMLLMPPASPKAQQPCIASIPNPQSSGLKRRDAAYRICLFLLFTSKLVAAACLKCVGDVQQLCRWITMGQ